MSNHHALKLWIQIVLDFQTQINKMCALPSLDILQSIPIFTHWISKHKLMVPLIIMSNLFICTFVDLVLPVEQPMLHKVAHKRKLKTPNKKNLKSKYLVGVSCLCNGRLQQLQALLGLLQIHTRWICSIIMTNPYRLKIPDILGRLLHQYYITIWIGLHLQMLHIFEGHQINQYKKKLRLS